MQAEGQKLLAALRKDDYVVALDERGSEMTTRELAAWLGNRMQDGRDLAFLVGGPGRVRARGARAKRSQVVAVPTDVPPRARAGRAGRAALSRAWRVGQSSVSSGLMGSMNSRSPLICLASVSPRRRELLAQIGVPHIVVGADIDETAQIGEAPRDYVLRMARQKALTVRERGESLPVLAADTTVVLDDVIYGKPRDREDGLAMLGRLVRSNTRSPDGRRARGFARGGGAVECEHCTFSRSLVAGVRGVLGDG